MDKKILFVGLLLAVLLISGCTSSSSSKNTDINEYNEVNDNVQSGASESQDTKETESNICKPEYDCDGKWSECIYPGFMIDDCYDKNECGFSYYAEGEASKIIDMFCKENESLVFCQKNIKIITKTCQYQAHIGDAIKIEDLSYSVNEIMALPIIGSDYMYQEAKGIFIVASISVKNNGKKSAYIGTNNFKLIDSQDREYKADSMDSVYLSTMGFEALPVFEDLGAGLQAEGYLVFDVPADDTGMKLKIDGTGLFSGSGYIILGDVSDFE